MPSLSIEFWIGTAIGAIFFIIGLAVTLAMDAKTRGEFRFAVGCFLLSAAGVIYGIEEWQVSVTWPARSRMIVAYALFALICMLTGEAIRWAHRRHLRAAEPVVNTEPPLSSSPSVGMARAKKTPRPPPISKALRFTTVIPIDDASKGVPIPINTNQDDPKSDFYSDLLNLTARPDQAPEGVTYKERKLDTPDDKFWFTTRLIQYYIIHSLSVLQRGRKGVKWIAGKGVTATDVMPIAAPDAATYPKNALIQTLADNEFLSPSERMFWDLRPFQPPRATIVSLREKSPDGKGPLECTVQFERSGYYRLDFIASPSFAIPGQPPAGFQNPSRSVSSYPVTVEMKYEIQRRDDGNFQPEAYAQWAENLFAGLKSIMAP